MPISSRCNSGHSELAKTFLYPGFVLVFFSSLSCGRRSDFLRLSCNYRPALASQSYMSFRRTSRKFIISSLTPSGASKNVA